MFVCVFPRDPFHPFKLLSFSNSLVPQQLFPVKVCGLDPFDLILERPTRPTGRLRFPPLSPSFCVQQTPPSLFTVSFSPFFLQVPLPKPNVCSHAQSKRYQRLHCVSPPTRPLFLFLPVGEIPVAERAIFALFLLVPLVVSTRLCLPAPPLVHFFPPTTPLSPSFILFSRPLHQSDLLPFPYAPALCLPHLF